MKTNNYKLWISIILIGCFGYLLNISIQAVFVPYVKFENNWCLDYERTDEDGQIPICNEFKNSLEEQKYYHQVKMQKRAQIIRYSVLTLCGFIGILIFAFITKEEKLFFDFETVFAGFCLYFFGAIWINLIFYFILPAPVKWFPEVFTEINILYKDEIMKQLEHKAYGK